MLSSFPLAQAPGCAVTVSVYDSALTNPALPANTKRYCLTLTGDGQHTPICQAFQYLFFPEYATFDTNWPLFTEWVKQANISLAAESTTLSRLGPVVRQATIDVIPDVPVNGQTLWEWLGLSSGAPIGDYAVRVKVGVVYDDGSIEQVDRITGQLTVNAGGFPVGGLISKQFTVHDRWQRLHDTDLIWAPCVAGMTVANAISILRSGRGLPRHRSTW